MAKAVEIAIELSKNSGISIITVTNYSSATGAIGLWARQIAQEGYIGIVLSQVNNNNNNNNNNMYNFQCIATATVDYIYVF